MSKSSKNGRHEGRKTVAAKVAPPETRKRMILACLLAMAAAFALYAPTVRYDFVTLDDPIYVETSPVVRHGFSWEGIKLAWTTAPENYWAPLLWMSYMADMELSGGKPWSCHLTNVILFSLNVGLLFLLVRRWTGRTGIALATVLLWAFHPTRVESVAWITERKDVLSGVFFFLGLWFYTIGREQPPRSTSAATGGPWIDSVGAPGGRAGLEGAGQPPRSASAATGGGWNGAVGAPGGRAGLEGAGQPPRSASAATGGPQVGAVTAPPTTNHQRTTLILLSWLCMLIGGMAKQVVIVMPAAMMLLDVWPLRRTDWDRIWKDVGRLVAEKWAFWLLAMGFAALPIGFHVARKAVVDVPTWHRALMIPVHYMFYLSKLVWPTRLMPLQPDMPSWWELLVGGFLVLAGVTWAAWRWRRRFPLALWGWLWFAVLLFPLSGVVWAGAERVAARFLYLTSIGLTLAAVVAAATWIRSRGWNARWGIAACALVLAVWGGMSLVLSHHWRSRDHFGIWVYTCNPGHPVACMLGGDGYLSQKNWAKASEAYEAGSSFWDAHCFLRLCILWNCCGWPNLSDDAWPRFEKGLGKPVMEVIADLRPLERILAWRIRGQCMQARGDLDGAIAAFQEAVALEEVRDAFVVAEYLRACHEAGKFGNKAKAVAKRMSKAAGVPRFTWGDLFPCYAQIWQDGARGYAYGYFLEYAQRYPEDAVGFNNMAWLLATAKPPDLSHARMDEWPAKAVEWAERAVALDEGKQAATAWDTLGAARANAGDFSGAIQAATKAAALARKGGGQEMAQLIERRIAGYRAGSPWRE